MKFTQLNFIFPLFFLLIFVGCENIGTSKFEGVAKGLDSQIQKAPDLFQVPSGINIISSASSFLLADQIKLRVSGTRAGDTIKIYNANCTVEVGSEVASGTTVDIVTSSLGIGSHSLRAKALSGSGDQISDCSTAKVNYTRLSMPSAIELVAPAPSSSLLADIIKLRVSGIKAGDNIKIYSDNCTIEVGSGVAVGATVDIITSSLSIGVHSLRSKIVNGVDQISDCSTSVANYTRLPMPSAIELVTPAPSSLMADKIKLRISGTKAGDTIKIYSDSCTTEVGSGVASGVTLDLVTSSLSIGQHSIRAKASRAGDQMSDCSTAVVDYTRLPMPSAIEILTPSSTSKFVDKINLRISGTRAGDTIKIYTDNCTTEVGSLDASGTSVDITTLSLDVGLNSLRVKALKGVNQISDCSNAVVDYTRASCPDNYILINANPDVATHANFCVAKYEMRCTGTQCASNMPGENAVAASISAGKPWVSINQINAKIACQNLVDINNVPNKFHLITNPEWMTIARNIESNKFNWSGEIVGGPGNYLNTGWTLATNTKAAPNSEDNNLFNIVDPLLVNVGANTGSFKYKRTHSISPVGEIWDFAGNVYELVDWYVSAGNKAYQLGGGTGWLEFINLNRRNDDSLEMEKSTYSPFNHNLLGSTVNFGKYNLGPLNDAGYAMRGGYWNFSLDSTAGIYTLNIRNDNEYAKSYIGFRCVYQP